MPNRMIKEGIRTSKQIGSLDDFAFRVWTYLLTYVDDYGRGSADPEILKGFLFARRKGTTEKNIQDALDKLACAGLVRIYVVDGEPFLYFPTWSKHQRIQTKQSKFPEPTEENEIPPYSTVIHGESPLETKPNQEETNMKKKGNLPERPDDFEAFWAAYPRHVGKEDARKALAKVKVPLQVLLDAIEKQKRSAQWTDDGGKYIPYPATWLNQGRWEDELPEPSGGKKNIYGGGGLGASELEDLHRAMAQPVVDLPPLPWED